MYEWRHKNYDSDSSDDFDRFKESGVLAACGQIVRAKAVLRPSEPSNKDSRLHIPAW